MTVRKNSVLCHEEDGLFLRVLKVRGDEAECQARVGRTGRYSKTSVWVKLAKLTPARGWTEVE